MGRRQRTIRSIRLALAFATLAAILACTGGGSPPPPPQGSGATTQATGTTGTADPGTITAPPGQVLITVAASSSPPGAVVTGGGRMLGRTPFTTQVPIPAPEGGAAQTFQFTFQLPGYQPTTISASPVNNTITLNAALAPISAATGAVDPATGATTGATGAAGGAVLSIRGPAGGAIYDNHTTTSRARVDQQCVIGSLSVDIDGTHTYFSDLVLTLIGPDGERYSLQSHSGRNPFRSYTVRRAQGHSSAGEWTVAIADTVGADSGVFRGWTMQIRCR